MQKSHRIWLAVPPDEKDAAINAHPRLDNGEKALVWDKEQKLWYARPGAELNNFDRWLPRPHELSMNAEDPVTEFAQKLEDAGLVINGLPVMDGSLQRVPTRQDKKGSKSGAYKGFMDGRPAGWYRDYRSADDKPTQWVFSGGQEMDPLARLHLRAQAQQTREDNARALAQQYDRQASYATRYVSRLEQATTSAYLTRKGVEAAPGVRINDKQELVIPFSNAQGQIRSYQRIPLTGGKDARILKDSEKTGNWFAMGTPQNGQPLLFAEGYATAASLHESTGLPVLMTIDAGNMIAAGQNARAVWPDSPFIFCADNDHHLKNPQTGEPENKGILSAEKAADLTGGKVITPDFTDEEKAATLTDFNDLDASRGRDAFREHISASLRSAGIDIQPDAAPGGPQLFSPKDINMENPESPESGQPLIMQDDPAVTLPAGNRLDDSADPTPAIPAEPEIIPAAPTLPGEVSPAAVPDNGLNAPDAPAAPNEPEIIMPAAPEPPGEVSPTAVPDNGLKEPDAPAGPRESDVLSPAMQGPQEGAVVVPGPEAQSVVGSEPAAPATGMDDYPDIRAHMDESQAGDWFNGQFEELARMDAQEQLSAHVPPEGKPEVKPGDTDAERPAPESPIVPPTPPQQPEKPHTTAGEENAPEPEPHTTKTAGNLADEADGLVYGPRRPVPLQREDLDSIIKALSTEELRDNTVLYRLDGQDAFRDLGNRLEMTDGASQDNRKVLAALAVASRFYGGVVELTGSPEFKDQAMRLIIENDLDIRMKLPAQRAQLDELRKQMGVTQDTITTHMPTPDLSRHTPSPDAAPPASPAPGAQTAAPATDCAAPAAPAAPTSPAPAPHVPPVNTPQPAAPATGQPEAAQTAAVAPGDSIKVSDEPAPSALKPGESVTAVLKNFGEAMYENKEQRGNSFFIELQNRGGSHTYWGQDLRDLIADHKPGDVVRLTLNSRDAWHVPGEERDRVKNNWSLAAASTGIAVAHDRPEQGQALMAFPVDTFGQLTRQISQAWPEHTADLKLPPRLEERQFWLGEDRHPVKAPQNAASITPPGGEIPARLTPVMASMDTQTNQMDLLLVQSAGNHLQGVVRLDGTLYPALATPTADNRQLVINAITDDGPRFAGYGQAVNFEPDGTTRAAPQLMTFHLKGREEETPLPARLYTPDKQADALFRNLGFDQTWKQWDDARKPEGRQEKTLHQEPSHSPGR
ncbi:LPD7 domain-containing protein [Enterobacter hormaechei]|uniref:LPD7 domain-containing protein n=1 Tax=Enterobacter hormaechei TaxID=158836 RepID=UPI001F4B0550|nr:LPD7 domain-containing protein [Enterobacter hormaechei]